MTFKGWLQKFIQPETDADLGAVKALRFMLQVHLSFFSPKLHSFGLPKCSQTASETCRLGTNRCHLFQNGDVSEV